MVRHASRSIVSFPNVFINPKHYKTMHIYNMNARKHSILRSLTFTFVLSIAFHPLNLLRILNFVALPIPSPALITSSFHGVAVKSGANGDKVLKHGGIKAGDGAVKSGTNDKAQWNQSWRRRGQEWRER
jgi:hypothetical protein